MTTQQLIDKVNELLETDKEFIQSKINKAIASGAMDIDGAVDNYRLPKHLLSAIYQDMAGQHSPGITDKKGLKDIQNIYRHIQKFIKPNTMKLTSEEKQVLIDILPMLDDELKNQLSTVRQFKWLASVPMSGDEYVNNKNVFELQDNAIERLTKENNFKRGVLIKLINS